MLTACQESLAVMWWKISRQKTNNELVYLNKMLSQANDCERIGTIQTVESKSVWRVLRPGWSIVNYDGLVMLPECQMKAYIKWSFMMNWHWERGSMVDRSCATKTLTNPHSQTPLENSWHRCRDMEDKGQKLTFVEEDH